MLDHLDSSMHGQLNALKYDKYVQLKLVALDQKPTL